MSTDQVAENAPTYGNRVVPHSWGGKAFSTLTEDDLLSIRDYIGQEAAVLGFNHGRRKCADAMATNPFHREFFLGYPFKFWNDVYSQSAREGEAQTLKEPFYEVNFQSPRDVLNGPEIPVSLAAIRAMKDLNGMYCQVMEDLDLPAAEQSLPEWRAALIWFDFKEKDLALGATAQPVALDSDPLPGRIKQPVSNDIVFSQPLKI